MSSPIIESRSLSRSFASGGESIDVLRGIDFSLLPGETASIRGESGCGKSTFLNLLAGLDTPSSGSVLWEGEDIGQQPRDWLARRRGALVGMVFQSYYLVPELRALENVLLGARISGAVDGSATDRARELLSRVGLGDRLRGLPSTLSGGERQRVAIARALITEPKLLLADEPTGNLDEGTGGAVMDLLLELCREKSVALVLVTHNASYAERLDSSWMLRKGVLETL